MGQANKKKRQVDKGNLAKEGSRYVFIGGLTTLVNLIIYRGALALMMPYGLATTLAFIVSVGFAFYFNAGFVFKKQMQFIDVIKFYGSRISTFAIEILGLVTLIEMLHWGEMMSKILMNILIIVLNYLISKFWIFRGTTHE